MHRIRVDGYGDGGHVFPELMKSSFTTVNSFVGLKPYNNNKRRNPQRFVVKTLVTTYYGRR